MTFQGARQIISLTSLTLLLQNMLFQFSAMYSSSVIHVYCRSVRELYSDETGRTVSVRSATPGNSQLPPPYVHYSDSHPNCTRGRPRRLSTPSTTNASTQSNQPTKPSRQRRKIKQPTELKTEQAEQAQQPSRPKIQPRPPPRRVQVCSMYHPILCCSILERV